MKYSADDIKDAWEKYKNLHVLKYMIDGKTSFIDFDGKRFPSIQGAIRPEVKNAKDVYSFPEYLEKKWTKT